MYIKKDEQTARIVYEHGDHIRYQRQDEFGTSTGKITNVFYGGSTFEVDDKYIIESKNILCLDKQNRRKLNISIKPMVIPTGTLYVMTGLVNLK